MPRNESSAELKRSRCPELLEFNTPMIKEPKVVNQQNLWQIACSKASN